jgi:hypothetical protein
MIKKLGLYESSVARSTKIPANGSFNNYVGAGKFSSEKIKASLNRAIQLNKKNFVIRGRSQTIITTFLLRHLGQYSI